MYCVCVCVRVCVSESQIASRQAFVYDCSYVAVLHNGVCQCALHVELGDLELTIMDPCFVTLYFMQLVFLNEQ